MSATTYRTRQQLCPHCGYLFDAVSALNGGAIPKPGDAALCFNCAEVMMFLSPTVFRKPSEDELRAISEEPAWRGVRRNQANLRQMISRGLRTGQAKHGQGRLQ